MNPLAPGWKHMQTVEDTEKLKILKYQEEGNRMKRKIAVVSLGDGRRDFYETRRHIAEEETKKLVETLGEYYDVFAPETAFNIDEALQVADEIRRQLIVQVVIHIPIWITPNLALRAAASTPYPVVLFGNTRKDSSSTVALLASAGMLAQSGKAYKRVIGDIRDEDVIRQVRNVLDGVMAAEGLRRSSFGMAGGRSIGIGTTVADPSQWQRLFGTEFDHCDQYEIVYRARELDETRVGRHVDWVKEHFTIQYGDLFTPEKLELQVRSYLALKDMAKERCYNFMGVKCQPDMSDHFVLQCLGVALLNHNVDADGPKDPIPTSCECDCDGALTMRLLSLCAGGKPSCLVDIRYFNGEEKEFILANCGSMAPYFADPQDWEKGLKETYLLPHVFGQAGGGAVQMVGKAGAVTCARFIRENGRYILTCFEGEMIEKPREELRKTNYSYPTQFIRADIDYDKFFHTMNSNHLHTIYGSYKEVLRNFCEITGVEFLCYNK